MAKNVQGLTLALLAALATVPSSSGVTADAVAVRRDRALSQVVMIHAAFGTPGVFADGAGIVIGESTDGAVHILTAWHVLHEADEPPSGVEVRVHDAPDTALHAQVVAGCGQAPAPDGSGDWAVMEISAEERRASFDPNWKAVPRTAVLHPDREPIVGGISVVGNPPDGAWSIASGTEVSRSGGLLSFRSSNVALGHSGGAVFDDDWRLLGMLLRGTSRIGGTQQALLFDRRLFERPECRAVATAVRLTADATTSASDTVVNYELAWPSANNNADLSPLLAMFPHFPNADAVRKSFRRNSGALRMEPVQPSCRETARLDAVTAEVRCEVTRRYTPSNASTQATCVCLDETFRVLKADGAWVIDRWDGRECSAPAGPATAVAATAEHRPF
jgi:hypothetical protein